MNPSGGDDGAWAFETCPQEVSGGSAVCRLVTRNIVIVRYTGGAAAGTALRHKIIL